MKISMKMIISLCWGELLVRWLLKADIFSLILVRMENPGMLGDPVAGGLLVDGDRSAAGKV